MLATKALMITHARTLSGKMLRARWKSVLIGPIPRSILRIIDVRNLLQVSMGQKNAIKQAGPTWWLDVGHVFIGINRKLSTARPEQNCFSIMNMGVIDLPVGCQHLRVWVGVWKKQI
jgi:hypothetical protein